MCRFGEKVLSLGGAKFMMCLKTDSSVSPYHKSSQRERIFWSDDASQKGGRFSARTMWNLTGWCAQPNVFGRGAKFINYGEYTCAIVLLQSVRGRARESFAFLSKIHIAYRRTVFLCACTSCWLVVSSGLVLGGFL